MEQKELDHIANDLLYLELCKEVAEAPDDEDYTEVGSRILKDLTVNHVILENQVFGLIYVLRG